MNNKLLAVLACDGYKIGHKDQDAPGVENKYYTWTPRSNKYLPEVEKVVVFGVQGFIKIHLLQFFNENFFELDKEYVVFEYKRILKSYLFKEEIDTTHIEELHDLGYLPLKIKAIKEGIRVPIRTPVLTVEVTNGKFAWLGGYIEDILSTSLWQPMTVASIAYEYKKLFKEFAMETVGNTEFCKFQGHDFSYRGLMAGLDAIQASGSAWLPLFVGTDNIPSIPYMENVYGADSSKEIIGCSVPASEHSVAETYMEFDDDGNLIPGWEDEYLRRLIVDIYPTGIVSIVADTIDLFELITVKLVALKEIIMARDGKTVIRPDSGNPADILCGYVIKKLNNPLNGDADKYYLPFDRWTDDGFNAYQTTDGKVYNFDHKELSIAETKGVVELLWEIFGGTINAKGYKELDSHIGTIYGDSITISLAREICKRLKAKGFASTNWVAGVGSYSLLGQLSRDSLGFALKETSITRNGKEIAVFKDPKTDDGTKKSAKGRVVVVPSPIGDGSMRTIDNLTKEQEEKVGAFNLLQTVFEDGVLPAETTLADIRICLGGI
jgi:nicotinamide phosphoribosyltransferase